MKNQENSRLHSDFEIAKTATILDILHQKGEASF